MSKRIAVVMAGLAACVTPYQEKGFGGGYASNQIGPGMWSIDVEVNSNTSAGTAMEYAYRRAGEVCPTGFDTVDGQKSQSDFYVRNGDYVTNNPKSNVSIIVKCRVAQQWRRPGEQ